MTELAPKVYQKPVPDYPLAVGQDMKPLTKDDGPLVWIDCEMTGLDTERDVIIEIAIIITNGSLVAVDKGIDFVIKTDKEVLDNMNEWCISQHGQSGLTAACLDPNAPSYEQVSNEVLEYVKKWIPEERIGVLAGNSVHADMRFLLIGMPDLMKHLHYRIVDVSTIKELSRRWYPEFKKDNDRPRKIGGESAHRALSDIEHSIQELKMYQEQMFVSNETYEKGLK